LIARTNILCPCRMARNILTNRLGNACITVIVINLLKQLINALHQHLCLARRLEQHEPLLLAPSLPPLSSLTHSRFSTFIRPIELPPILISDTSQTRPSPLTSLLLARCMHQASSREACFAGAEQHPLLTLWGGVGLTAQSLQLRRRRRWTQMPAPP